MESNAMLQRRPFQKLHRDEGLGIMLADLINRADVGMIEGRRSAGFAPEALGGLGVLGKFFRKEFQADEASNLKVFGLVDHAHPAAAELLDYAVMRYGFADHSRPGSSPGHGRRDVVFKSTKAARCRRISLRYHSQEVSVGSVPH